jgi:hypothetical protein
MKLKLFQDENKNKIPGKPELMAIMQKEIVPRVQALFDAYEQAVHDQEELEKKITAFTQKIEQLKTRLVEIEKQLSSGVVDEKMVDEHALILNQIFSTEEIIRGITEQRGNAATMVKTRLMERKWVCSSAIKDLKEKVEKVFYWKCFEQLERLWLAWMLGLQDIFKDDPVLSKLDPLTKNDLLRLEGLLRLTAPPNRFFWLSKLPDDYEPLNAQEKWEAINHKFIDLSNENGEGK